MSRTTAKKTLWVLATLGTFALVGCGEETSSPATSEAPALPPVQSLTFDIGFFNQNKPAGAPATRTELMSAEAEFATQLNFLNAVVRVAFVEVAILTGLTPPSLALHAALHTFPSRDDDGAYLWIYTWRENGQDNQIRLRAVPNGQVVDWELFIGTPGKNMELWFYGQSQEGTDEGYWVFVDFTREGDPEVLRIDWIGGEDDNARLELEDLDSESEDFGDELRFIASGNDRILEFYDASDAMTWDVRWDESDGTGSLMVPDYKDGERACWDAGQQDTVCEIAGAASR